MGISERAVWRSAARFVNEYGELAELKVDGRLNQVISDGDPAGEAVWKRIAAAVRELKRTVPVPGERVN